MNSRLSYWQVFRLVLVIYFIYLMGNVFRIWEVYEYNASSEFAPAVAVISVIWCLIAALSSLMAWAFFFAFEWMRKRMRWKVTIEHLLLYMAFVVLCGGIIWTSKKLIWPSIQLTSRLGVTAFIAGAAISLIPAWLLRSRSERWLGVVQSRITPLVWMCAIVVVISLPLTAYQVWQERNIFTEGHNDQSERRKPMVSFVFDDGYETTFTKAKSIFRSQGEVASAAITLNFIGKKNRMTAAHILELQNDGWEILGHSITHPNLTALTGEEIDHELKASKEGLEALGFEIVNFVYPFYKHNAAARNVARKYYRSARAGDNSKTGFNINPHILRVYALSAIDIENHDSLAALQRLVDKAEENNAWLMITYHNVIPHREVMLDPIIDYIQEKRVKIVTINQGLDLVEKRESRLAQLLFILNEDSPFHIMRNVHVVSQRLLALIHESL